MIIPKNYLFFIWSSIGCPVLLFVKSVWGKSLLLGGQGPVLIIFVSLDLAHCLTHIGTWSVCWLNEYRSPWFTKPAYPLGPPNLLSSTRWPWGTGYFFWLIRGRGWGGIIWKISNVEKQRAKVGVKWGIYKRSNRKSEEMTIKYLGQRSDRYIWG